MAEEKRDSMALKATGMTGKKRSLSDKKKPSKFSPKKKKKGRREDMRLSKRNAAIEEIERVTLEAKKLSAQVLQKTAKSDQRKENVTELFLLLKGKVRNLAMKHDLCRTIQCCFRFGTDDQKQSILKELKDEIVTLCKGKYSCFMIVAFLRHGSTQHRLFVLKEIKGHMKRLGTHNCGAHVADLALQTTSHDTKQLKSLRTSLWNEFYGQRFAIAVANAGLDLSNSKALKCYDDIDLKTKLAILTDLKQVVLKIADKGLLRYAYAQRLSYEFICKTEPLRSIESEDAQKFYSSSVSSLVPLISEASLAMISTSEGTKCICRTLALSGAKEKKKLIKKWKGHINNISIHEYGYLAIVTALNTTDDTVLLKKFIISELVKERSSEEVLACILDPTGIGRKLYLYLLVSQDKLPRYFSPTEIKVMTPVEGTSKKDPDMRRSELNKQMKDILESCCIENVEQIASDKKGSDVLLHVLSRWWNEDVSKSIVKMVENNMKELLEHPTAQVTIKRAVNIEKEHLEHVENKSDYNMGSEIWKLMKPSVKAWLSINRASFVINSLLEHPETASDVRSSLLKHDNVMKKHEGLASIKVIRKNLKA